MVMMDPLEQMLSIDLRQYHGQSELLDYDSDQLASHYQHPVQVLDEVAHQLKLDSKALQRQFGRVLFQYLLEKHPDLLDNAKDSFELFCHPDTPLQLEISHIYADREPPRFTVIQWQPPELLVFDYQSSLPFAHVCHGFLKACSNYFAEPVIIHQQLIDGALNHARFTMSHPD